MIFYIKFSIFHNKFILYFNQWKALVTDKLNESLETNVSDQDKIYSKSIFNKIIIFKKNYVISYVDKSPNYYGITCKSYNYQFLAFCISFSNSLKKINGELIVNNRKITSYYLLLNMPLRNFNDPFWLCASKSYKKPIKFRIVTTISLTLFC